MTDTLLETARLRLRRLGPADAAALHAVYGDADAMRWVGDGRPLDLAACEHWIALTQRNYTRRGYGMFAIVESARDAAIGFCGLVHPADQPLAELKYALHRAAWGRGFATEAAGALLICGAERFALPTIIATVAPENAASQRVLCKIGMRRGERRQAEDGQATQVFTWSPGDPGRP